MFGKKGEIIMKVKNKKKFIRAIILIIGITISLVLLMTGKTFSHQEPKYKNVAIISGDTLWDIAAIEQKSNEYYKDKDIRDIIQDIISKNNLKSSTLKADQILEIPTL